MKLKVNIAASKSITMKFATRNESLLNSSVGISEKVIFDRTPKGNSYKAIINDNTSKIIARIDDKIYGFSVLVGESGTSEKLKQAYRDLRQEERKK